MNCMLCSVVLDTYIIILFLHPAIVLQSYCFILVVLTILMLIIPTAIYLYYHQISQTFNKFDSNMYAVMKVSQHNAMGCTKTGCSCSYYI
jgi:hypothetical protein